MHSSPKRDEYVDIVWDNVAQDKTNNFYKYNLFQVSNFGVEYDYDSILHYSRQAFSANGLDTIVPKQAGAIIGQRNGLSEKDVQKVIKMYCDANSANVQACENTPNNTKTKEQKSKYKPFEETEFVIGKAVAI